MRKQRIYEFDLIKLIAMLSVFTIHFTRELENAGIQAAVKIFPDTIFHVYLGGFGVSLFFIVSGASLMYVYGDSCKLKQFYKKRFLAIYPMFWMAFLIATGIQFFRLQNINPAIPKWKIIYSVLGIDGNALWWGPNFYQLGEWFLGVIICLYVIFPLLRNCLIRSAVWTIVVSAVIFVLCILFIKGTLPIECFFLVRIPEFLIGMLFIKYRKYFSSWWMNLISAAVIITISCIPMENIHIMIRNLAIGASCFLIFANIFSRIPLRIYRKGVLSAACRVGGRYNYAFFLTHHFIITLAATWFSGAVLRRSEVWLLYLCVLGITAAATKLLYTLHGGIVQAFSKSE